MCKYIIQNNYYQRLSGYMGMKVNETNIKILTGRNSFCFQTYVTGKPPR